MKWVSYSKGPKSLAASNTPIPKDVLGFQCDHSFFIRRSYDGKFFCFSTDIGIQILAHEETAVDETDMILGSHYSSADRVFREGDSITFKF